MPSFLKADGAPKVRQAVADRAEKGSYARGQSPVQSPVDVFSRREIERKTILYRNMLAERAGFEPALRSPVNTLSRRAPSTTRPPLRPCMSRRPVSPRGLGRCTSLGARRNFRHRRRQPANAFPAPEPSKQQARGSSSRSRAECQAITVLYSLCRPHGVSRSRRRARFRGARTPNDVHRQGSRTRRA